MLAFELSSCHSSITILKSLNDDLNARVEKINVASSSVKHVSMRAKCKDHDFNACSNHVSTIAKLSAEIAHLNVQLKNCKNEVEKVKFARDVLPLVDIPLLRIDLVSKREPRTLRAKRTSTSQRRRGRHLWLIVCIRFTRRKNYDYLYSHVRSTSHNAYQVACNDGFTPRTMFASSSDKSITWRHAPHIVSHAPKSRNASHGPSILFRIFDAPYVIHCKKMIKLLLQMWNRNARKVRLECGFQNLI
jgi:hypothetical protein